MGGRLPIDCAFALLLLCMRCASDSPGVRLHFNSTPELLYEERATAMRAAVDEQTQAIRDKYCRKYERHVRNGRAWPVRFLSH
jgi:hypothetical protein